MQMGIGGDVGISSGHILKSVLSNSLRDLWVVDLKLTEVFLKPRLRSCKAILRPQHRPRHVLLHDSAQIRIQPANFNQLPAWIDDCCGSCSALLSSLHDTY